MLNELDIFKLSDFSCASILTRKSHLSLVRFLNPFPSLPNTKTDFFQISYWRVNDQNKE